MKNILKRRAPPEWDDAVGAEKETKQAKKLHYKKRGRGKVCAT